MHKFIWQVSSSILATAILIGCSTQSGTSLHANLSTGGYSGSYCYNGGRVHEYSCDPTLASSQPDMHPDEIDEEWMYATLYEIKRWFSELRALHYGPMQKTENHVTSE